MEKIFSKFYLSKRLNNQFNANRSYWILVFPDYNYARFQTWEHAIRYFNGIKKYYA